MVGPWPSPPPFPASARVALSHDGSLAAVTTAHLLDRWGLDWVALNAPSSGPVSLSGWAASAEAAVAAGAGWLVTGVTEDEGSEPLALRLFAAESAMRAFGLEGLWAPLVGYTELEVGRLAVALGVPFEDVAACRRGDHDRMFRELGVASPSASKA